MELYFSDLPNIGNLFLEYTLYEYVEPVLFVCQDEHGNRWFCSCSRLSEQWLVCKTDISTLLSVLKRKVSLDSVFRDNHSTVCLQWDGNQMHYSTKIPDDAYPKTGAILGLTDEQVFDYIGFLTSETEQIQERVSSADIINQSSRYTGFTVCDWSSLLSSDEIEDKLQQAIVAIEGKEKPITSSRLWNIIVKSFALKDTVELPSVSLSFEHSSKDFGYSREYTDEPTGANMKASFCAQHDIIRGTTSTDDSNNTSILNAA